LAHYNLFDPQVIGDLLVAPRTGQHRFGYFTAISLDTIDSMLVARIVLILSMTMPSSYIE
ncbi:MAG: hypothetical protein QNJ82_14135, partial [Gammaproteobacteria bacterium]|nr:hypothetical protein [Gammaproteobacteria bacterium]